MTLDPNPRSSSTQPTPLEAQGPSPATSTGPAALETQDRQPELPYTRLELWLHRITVLMFVFLCAVVGLLLMVMPWRPEWTDNHLLLTFPSLRPMVAHGFVRGLCSGLGVLDIWIGFWEAVHYREEPVEP